MKNLLAAGTMIAAICLASSCASSPSVTVPEASVRFVSVPELKSAFGYSFDINPYLEPSSLIRGKLSEFIVLRVDLSLPKPTKVSAVAQLVGQDGNTLESSASLDKMTFFWSMWETSDTEAGKRLTSLERSYVPAPEFTARAGKSSYYLVIVGKYPFPRPAKVFATVLVEGLDQVAFEEDLYPLPPKK
jgi:hypothetical protein